MTYELALQCLSDPTRRRIFERLRGGPRSVGVLARGLPVTRPAVSQHLRALKDAGLVADRPEGAKRIYYIDPHGLGELRRWLDGFWDDALAAFKDAVEATGSPSSRGDRQ
jgi:DNA-binding transcriptional ArsR family regulator